MNLAQIQPVAVPSPLRAGWDLPAQKGLPHPQRHPLLAFHPQPVGDRPERVLEEVRCCCCRILEPGWEFAALLAPFCRDDLDTCPGFAIWGMLYIPDDWKQASGSQYDLQ